MTKKLIPTFILVILISLCFTVKAATFTDVNKSDWFYDDIMKLEEKGIINGFLDRSFKPRNKVTYEQFIKMVIVTLKINVEKDNNHWSLPYIEKAKQLKFINFSIKNYKTPITRGDMSLILSNVLEHLKEEVTIEYNNLYDLPGYTNEKYIQSILKLYNAGIITGFPDNTFRCDDFMTRAHACAVLNRLATPNNRQKPVISSYNHVSACPFYIKDNKNYYEIVNKFEVNLNYDIPKIIEILAGEDGYLVIEYKKLPSFNMILIKYFQNENFSNNDMYSMFTLYLYDGETNYPEVELGYNSMFAELQLKSLIKQYYSNTLGTSHMDTFYEYKLRGLLCLIFGEEKGKDLGNYIINNYLKDSSDDVELREKDGIKTIFFTTGKGTIGNYTFSKLE